jgi:hypothetical protein
MNRRAYKTSIPTKATEIVKGRHSDGSKKVSWYYLNGEKVGVRNWYEDGQLEFEIAMRNGVKHAWEYRFHENANLLEREGYHEGQLHGIGRQWAEDGRLLVTWRMVNGTGLDLWCDEEGRLAEEHYWPKPGELGYTRQWNPDDWTINEEYFYILGKGYHGVWRKWNGRGRMKRGFPRFFVCDRKVTKTQYAKACEANSTLPPYRVADDNPRRELPEAYLRQRRQRL